MRAPKLVDVRENPEHYNPRADALIPGCWEAFVDTFDPYMGIVTIMGATREEALEIARAEFPGLRGGVA